MPETKIHSQWTTIKNQDDLEIAAYFSYPQQAGLFPAVIVLQEIFGVNSHIRDITERFAKIGYAAIAPALYQRLAPGYETGYTTDDIQQGRRYKDLTKASELLADIQATIEFLKTQPFVKPGKVGCIGFCFGGHVAYLGATLPEIKATASFYGAGIPTFTPGGGEPTITRTGEIKGTIYGFFGENDASIPPEHIEQIETQLEKHQIPHHVFRYAGASHGFFCDQRSSYNQEAAADAWQQVQQLFSQTL